MFSKISRHLSSKSNSRHSLGRQETSETSTAVTGGSETDHVTNDQSSILDRPRKLSIIPSFQRDRTPNRSLDPQGLIPIYTPPASPSADIIFVHGLGGSSQLTWAKNHDINLFWPREWLPLETDVSSARIFSFGYDAQFKSQEKRGVLSISDFARDLLYQMRYPPSEYGKLFPLGKCPIIFVAHSMGGLVVKKAFLYGQYDATYKPIIDSIRSILFLSTPHHGTQRADQLNKVLKASMLYSPQKYISEMARNGPFIEEINEQFRNVAPRLQIFSFYETLPTDIGTGPPIVILKKSSAVLGYPGEVCKPINADHHNVCKFDSIEDIRYRNICSVLQSLISTYPDEVDEGAQGASSEECKLVAEFLSAEDSSPNHDLSHFLSRWNPNTCSWILQSPEFQNWVETPLDSAIIWVHGKPGSGKSVLSSYLIRHLRERGAAVQCFFFRSGEQTKKSAGSLLRSLAIQLSQIFPAFRKALIRLRAAGLSFRKADWQSIWDHIFKSTLLTLDLPKPIYWIIDGIEESDADISIMNMLGSIYSPVTPIRVMLVSRWTTALSSSFAKLGKKLSVFVLCMDHSSDDALTYTQEALADLQWPPELKEEVTQKIADQANGSFLWVHLALEEVKACHTMQNVKEALNELPDGMESQYDRMVASISQNNRRSDPGLQRCLFIWTLYSRNPVTIEELSQILQPEWQLFNLQFTISQLCGHFLVIEDGRRVGLVHGTAREYLQSKSTLPFSLEPDQAHYDMFHKCISAFMSPSLGPELENTQAFVPLSYRATAWAHHLNRVSISKHSYPSLCKILEFFRGTSVLLWIQVLASLNKLSALIDTSRRLSLFIQRTRKGSAADAPQHRMIAELEFLQLWTRDLLKLVAKFGSNLLSRPTAIHDCIIPFCPLGSAMFKTYKNGYQQPLRVLGLSEDWDDCITRVSVGSMHQASMLACSGRYLAVSDSTPVGTISVWSCVTFKKIRKLTHGEHINAFCFGYYGDCLASYGVKTTKIWNVETGELKISIPSISGVQAMALVYAESDTLLMLGSERLDIFGTTLSGKASSWKATGASLSNENHRLSGTYMNSPTGLSFSHDRSMAIAVYRRSPLTIWSLKPTRVLKRVSRLNTDGSTVSTLSAALHAQWHPNDQEIIGIFADGCIFKVGVQNTFQKELEPEPGSTPSRIQCSPDGRVFATSDLSGTIKLYDYQTFSLLYQLTREDFVTQFCFSHDSKRFYDIRANYCNVWEPNVLIRLSEPDHSSDLHSESDSIAHSNLNSDVVADMAASITALCPAGRGAIVCTGDDDGLVEVHDYRTGERQILGQSASQLCVEHLSWSSDCSHFAYADIAHNIVLFSAQTDKTGVPLLHNYKALGRFRAQNGSSEIIQILHNSNGKQLLVVFNDAVQLWITEPPSFSSPIANTEVLAGKWISHPARNDQLLLITPTTVTSYKWDDLSKVSKWNISTATPSKDELSDAFLTHSKFYLILTVTRNDLSNKSRFAIVDIRSLFTNNPTSTDILGQVQLPDDIMEQMERPLNIFGPGRLVFVDQSFWVCSWQLGSDASASSIKRHFFIPMDWINVGSLNLLHMTENGTILCPRRGQLVAIESSLISDW